MTENNTAGRKRGEEGLGRRRGEEGLSETVGNLTLIRGDDF